MAWVSVEGEVSRLHGQGGGFGLKESWQAQGKDRQRFWAVFPKEQVQVGVGDRVKVSGGLQTSVTDPKSDSQGVDRVYVDHVVGQAKVEVTQAAQPGQGGGVQSGWHNPTPAQSSDVTEPPSAFGGGFDNADAQPF